MFKKPIDPYKDLTDEEVEAKMDEFAENDFDREDEKAMIHAALTTLFPAVVLTCLAVAGLVLLVAKIVLR